MKPLDHFASAAAVLTTAAEAVSGAKAEEHGSISATFSVAADLWSSWLNVRIEPHEVAVLMALYKLARMRVKPDNPDNYLDSAAYAAIAAELRGMALEAEAARTTEVPDAATAS